MPQGSLRRFPLGGVVLAFLLGLLIAGFLNLPGSSAAQQETRYAVTPAAPAPAAGAASLQSLSEAFASVAEAVKPSVVFIKSGRRADNDEPGQSPAAAPGPAGLRGFLPPPAPDAAARVPGGGRLRVHRVP